MVDSPPCNRSRSPAAARAATRSRPQPTGGYSSASRIRSTCSIPCGRPMSPAPTRRRKAIVSLPLGSVSVTFDEDMFVGDPPIRTAVLDPANYSLAGDNTGPIAINRSVTTPAQPHRRLEFDNLNADHYTLKVVDRRREAPPACSWPRLTPPISRRSPTSRRSSTSASPPAGPTTSRSTVSYNVVITNKTAYNLIVATDPLRRQPAARDAAVVGGMRNAARRPVVARPQRLDSRQRAAFPAARHSPRHSRSAIRRARSSASSPASSRCPMPTRRRSSTRHPSRPRPWASPIRIQGQRHRSQRQPGQLPAGQRSGRA